MISLPCMLIFFAWIGSAPKLPIQMAQFCWSEPIRISPRSYGPNRCSQTLGIIEDIRLFVIHSTLQNLLGQLSVTHLISTFTNDTRSHPFSVRYVKRITMNIFLIPYTWVRHFQFAVWSALCGLIAWWIYLLSMTQGWVFWSPTWDAFMTNGLLVVSVVCANVLGLFFTTMDNGCAHTKTPIGEFCWGGCVSLTELDMAFTGFDDVGRHWFCLSCCCVEVSLG